MGTCNKNSSPRLPASPGPTACLFHSLLVLQQTPTPLQIKVYDLLEHAGCHINIEQDIPVAIHPAHGGEIGIANAVFPNGRSERQHQVPMIL